MKWELATKNNLPKHEIMVFIKFGGNDKIVGIRDTVIELIENGWEKVEWLNEEDEIKDCCPHCRSADIIMFDPDNDLCKTCGRYFPAVISHTRTGIAV